MNQVAKRIMEKSGLIGHLVNPDHYERMVNLLMFHNPSCPARVWAEDVIDLCIRGALESGDCSTGMCAAYRQPFDGKVRLFLEPLRAMPVGKVGILVTNEGEEMKATKGVFYTKAKPLPVRVLGG